MDWRTGIRFLASLGIFSPRPRLQTGSVRPTQPLIRWVPRVHSPGLKWPGREADISPYLVPRLRIRGDVCPLPQYVFIVSCLIKQRKRLHNILISAQGQFYLTVTESYNLYYVSRKYT